MPKQSCQVQNEVVMFTCSFLYDIAIAVKKGGGEKTLIEVSLLVLIEGLRAELVGLRFLFKTSPVSAIDFSANVMLSGLSPADEVDVAMTTRQVA